MNEPGIWEEEIDSGKITKIVRANRLLLGFLQEELRFSFTIFIHLVVAIYILN